MWDDLEGKNRAFLEALRDGSVTSVRDQLSRMFQGPLVWGMTCVLENWLPELRRQTPGNPCQKHFTDLLVSLAEAVGATRLTNAEQEPEAELRALDVDLDDLFRAVEQQTNLDLSFPEVRGACGCQVAGKRVSPDCFQHGYTVYRLRQLGAKRGSRIAEIGGGYGCLAALFYRAGHRRLSIYDLPWVNALQGYFLIMSLPAGSVRLYGESHGSLAVLPHWCFHKIPDRSVDFVINTNSLPEMGAETARAYVAHIRKVLKGLFFSINQEAKAPVLTYGPQQCVAELVAEVGGFTSVSRYRFWMRNGYVEEVFRLSQARHRRS